MRDQDGNEIGQGAEGNNAEREELERQRRIFQAPGIPEDNQLPQQIPVMPRIIEVRQSLHQIIQGMRRYDGSTPAEKWVTQFKRDLVRENLSHRWALENLDRILDGPAKSWWEGLSQYNDPEPEDDHGLNFELVMGEIKKFFGEEAAKNSAKIRNKDIVFKLKEDPQIYVTRKVEVLKIIDNEMKDEKVIKNLVKGLPRELALQMAASCDEFTTPTTFLNKLRKLVEVERRDYDSQASSSQSRSRNSNSTASTFSGSTGKLSLDQLRAYVSPDGRKICTTCHKPGHLSKNCRFNPKNNGQTDVRVQAPNNNGDSQGQSNSNPRQFQNQQRTFVNQNYQRRGNYQGRNYNPNYQPNNQPRPNNPQFKENPVQVPQHNQVSMQELTARLEALETGQFQSRDNRPSHNQGNS